MSCSKWEIAPSGGHVGNRLQDEGWGRWEVIAASSRSEEVEMLRGSWILDISVFKPYLKPLGQDVI